MESVGGAAPLSTDEPAIAGRKLAAALGPRTGHVAVVAASAADADALLARVESEMVSYRCAWLDGDALDVTDLLRALGSETEETPSLPARLRALGAEARAIGRPVVLIVRRADVVPAARLELLRLMTDGGDSSEWLRLVLLGGPPLLAALREPAGRALASRVTSLIVVQGEIAAAPLPATSELMQAPQPTPARRWPSLGRIAASALLGSVVAGAIVPLFSTPPAPAVRAVAPAEAPPAAAVPATPPPAVMASAPVAEPVPSPSEQPVPAAPIVAPPPASRTVPAPAPRPVAPATPRAVVHPPDAPHVAGRTVQVGAFRDPGRAAALRDELAKQFEWVMVTRVERDGVVWHRVRIEGLENAAAVQNAMAALRRAGHQPIPVR